MYDHPAEWRVYFILGVLGTTVFVTRALMLLIGAGHHDFGHIDHGHDMHGDESFQVVTLASVACLFMGIGWSGLAFRYEAGLDVVRSMAAACGVGFIFLFGSSFLMRQVMKLATPPRGEPVPVVGMKGEVYTGISKGAVGKIRLNTGKEFLEVSAVADYAIDAFTEIEVIKVFSPKSVAVKTLN